MGKTSKPFAGGTVTINGDQKANVSMGGNRVDASFNMNDAEKSIYDYAQNSYADSLPQLNVFSDATRNQLNSQLNSYINQGTKYLNNLYEPMLENMKTDIARRFGNLDNSSFLDQLDNIETKRADSMSAFAQDIMAKQNELYNDELSRRYAYLNLLSGIQDSYDSRIMNYMNMAMKNSSAGNSYNKWAANQELAAFNAMASAISSTIDSIVPG